MSTLLVTKNEMKELANEYWSEVFSSGKTMSDEEVKHFKTNLYAEKFNNIEIVLEQKPKHNNPKLVKLVERFCDDMSVKNKDCTIYRGSAAIGYGEGTDDFYRPIINMKTLDELNFTYNSEWSGAFRLVYLNEKELATLTICEGDLIITIHNTKEDYEREMIESEKFYQEN